MISLSFTGLINNVALLLTMGVVYGSLPSGLRARQWSGKLLNGFLLGMVGICLMMNPWQLIPGVIFDARSILLSVGGLFLGLIPIAVALVMTCLYRLYEGGAGALTGSAVIITSGVIGLMWSRLRQQPVHHFSGWEYYLFGLTVHISMLLWMLTLPHPVGITVLKNISLPVMLIFPVGTVLFAKLLAGQELRLDNHKILHESQERFKALAETSPLAIYLSTGIEQKAKYINPTFVRLFGYDMDEVPSAEQWWPLAYPDETYRREISEKWQRSVAHAMATGSETEQIETMVTCRDGSRKTILWGFKTIGDENWAFGLDLTMLKRVEQEAVQKNALLEAQLNTTIDGILIADAKGNTIIQNQLYIDMWDIPEDIADSHDGRQQIDFIKNRVKNPERFVEKIDHLYAHPQESDREEIALKGGQILDRYSAPIIGKDGTCFGRIWTFRDITGQKQVETALRQSEATVRNKLKAIVEPEGDIDALELSDIIDTEIMQSMMEYFYQLTGMLGAVLDTSGKVLVAVGWQDICTKFHRCHPDTRLNCIESDTVLTHDVAPGTFKRYRCKNNMYDMVTPLMVGNRHVGNVFIGQFFYDDEPPDVELFRKQARHYGFDEAKYLEALKKVPRFSREKVNAGMHFYAKLTGLVSSLSFSSIQQSRMLAERRQAWEEIRQSKERFQIIFEQAPIGIGIISSITGEIYHVNSKYAKIVGRSRKEMETIDWMSITHPDDVAEDLANMARLNDGKIDSFQMNKRYIKPDGAVIWVNMSVVPLKGEGDLSQRHIAIIEDITERKQAEDNILLLLKQAKASRQTLLSVVEDQKRAEEKIRRLNEELEQRVLDRTTELRAANKELEAFSYSVSHDLRAPLRSIDGFSQALLEDYSDKLLDDTGKDFLGRVRKASQRMGVLIDDMLTLSRISKAEIKKQPIDLSGMIRAIAQAYQEEYPDRIVDVTVKKGIMVQGDPHLLAIAMENIVSNAFKFTSKKASPRIEFGTAVKDGKTACFIRDNGAGFEMAYVNKLFNAFQRLHTTDEFPGTGIGLAIVQRIISRHGGRVSAESEIEKGATVYFTL